MDINTRSNDGKTPLIWSAYWGHYDVVRILVESNHDSRQKCNVHAQDIKGMTALMYATLNNHYHVVEYLIRMNSPVITRNKVNGTALSIAKAQENMKLIALLEPYFPIHERYDSPFVASMYYILVHMDMQLQHVLGMMRKYVGDSRQEKDDEL